MSFIFISYSRQDQAYVSLLAQALESHNLPVWLDDHINYGATWPRVIREQLERCQLVLVVMSPRSEDSHWVQCELTHALEIRKPIFPLLLEGPRWFSVASLQTVDVTSSKLPPARFFDILRPHFPAPTSTAASTLIQEVATDAIPPAPVGWAPPTTTPEQKPATAQLVQEDNLSSEKGVDYRKLRDLLKAGQWKEADIETNRLLLEAIGRHENDFTREDELLNFPCTDLLMVDALWVKYSRGKWGFSVQKCIYIECGANLDGNLNDEIWEDFCHRVGWFKGNSYVKYSDVTFDLGNSPAGEFPRWWGRCGGAGGGGLLFSRLETCKP